MYCDTYVNAIIWNFYYIVCIQFPIFFILAYQEIRASVSEQQFLGTKWSIHLRKRSANPELLNDCIPNVFCIHRSIGELDINDLPVSIVTIPDTARSYTVRGVINLSALQWRHNERDGVSNHLRLHCLLICWFRSNSKKTSKLRVTGLCEGNSPVTGVFPAQKASNAENAYIWWRHHGM